MIEMREIDDSDQRTVALHTLGHMDVNCQDCGGRVAIGSLGEQAQRISPKSWQRHRHLATGDRAAARDSRPLYWKNFLENEWRYNRIHNCRKEDE